MPALILRRCEFELLDWYGKRLGPVWVARDLLAEEELARLRRLCPVTILDRPVDPGDGAAVTAALDVIQQEHPGETLYVEGPASTWLDELRGTSVDSLEYESETLDWVFGLTACFLRVSCAWRLVTKGHVQLGQKDDGHPFGLGKPLDASQRLLEALAGRSIVGVRLVEDTADLSLDFGGGTRLDFFNDSCGYEGWNLYLGERWVTAQGGGRVSLGRHARPR